MAVDYTKLLDGNSLKAIKSYIDGKIPSVSNATITIKQSGRADQTFTLNGSNTSEDSLVS